MSYLVEAYHLCVSVRACHARVTQPCVRAGAGVAGSREAGVYPQRGILERTHHGR